MVPAPRPARILDRAAVLLAIALLFGLARPGRAQLTDLGSRLFIECAAPGDCNALELFASAFAVCDFDDDGIDDLAVGVPGETVGPNAEAGSLHIYYGSIAGLTTAGEQVFDLDDIDLSGGADVDDHLGEALAAGDFDLDGICDLAAGAPGKAVGAPGNHAGAAVVFFGSLSGLRLDNFRFLSQNHLPPGSSESSEQGDRFGSALAALPGGDLAVGVPGEELIPVAEDAAGMLHVLRAAGPGDPFDSVVDRDQSDYSSACPDGNEIADQWGAPLVAGKFGAAASLVVGADFEDVGLTEFAGRVTVIGAPVACFDQNTGGLAETAETGDHLGKALASGDFNDDGFDDLAIGVPFEDLEATGDTGAGVVQVLYGSDAGLETAGDQIFDQNAFPSTLPEDQDNLGSALASGDFDADGFDDLAIGAPTETVSGSAGAGLVNVLYGSDAGLTATESQTFHADLPSGMPDQVEPDDQFGAALAAGDFDDNGTADLVIGVPREDGPGGGAMGAFTVVYGLRRSIDAFGTVAFSSAVRTVSESAGAESIVVNRTGGAVLAASVDHARTGGSATPGSDFTYTPGSESWDVGDLGGEFFTLNVIDDTLDEPDQTLVLGLSNPSAGLAIGKPGTFTLTIEDNDVAGVVGFFEFQPVYGVREDAGSFGIAVLRTGGAASGVTVQYTTSNATAVAGADYTATSGTLTFGANDNAESIIVPIIDDKSAEGAENFLITLTNPGGGATLVPLAQVSVFIGSDDIFHNGFETGNSTLWSDTVP